MTAQYKVLSAMLGLHAADTFTVKDIVRLSRINPATVRTIIARRRDLWESAGQDDSGSGRGGRYLRYRFRPGMFEQLRQDLQRTFAELREANPPAAAGEGAVAEPPIGLLTAEEILWNRFLKAKDVFEKRHLLEVAKLDLQAAREEIELLPLNGPTDTNPLLCKLGALEQEQEKACNALKAYEELVAATVGLEESDAAVPVAFRGHIQRAHKYLSNLVSSPDLAVASVGAAPVFEGSTHGCTRKIMVVADGALANWARELGSIVAHDPHAEVRVLEQPVSAREASYDDFFRDDPFGEFLLAVDSDNNADGAVIACQRIIDELKPRKLYVLDVGVNPQLRNHILVHHGHYEPCAMELENDALLTMMDLATGSSTAPISQATPMATMT